MGWASIWFPMIGAGNEKDVRRVVRSSFWFPALGATLSTAAERVGMS